MVNLLRRRSVTLLEMLIVMAILAMAAGIVAIGVSRAVVDQRFRTEVGIIVDELRLAQDLMLILGTDVRLKFQKAGDEGIDFWLELETKVKESLQQELLKKHHILKTIRGVFFYDTNATDEIRDKVEVRFLSNGSVMSSGIMRLATSDQEDPPPGALQTYIPLVGFPSPIGNIDNFEEAERIYEGYENPSFNQNLTIDTFSKLPEKMKANEEKPEENGGKETTPGSSSEKSTSPQLKKENLS